MEENCQLFCLWAWKAWQMHNKSSNQPSRPRRCPVVFSPEECEGSLDARAEKRERIVEAIKNVWRIQITETCCLMTLPKLLSLSPLISLTNKYKCRSTSERKGSSLSHFFEAHLSRPHKTARTLPRVGGSSTLISLIRLKTWNQIQLAAVACVFLACCLTHNILCSIFFNSLKRAWVGKNLLLLLLLNDIELKALEIESHLTHSEETFSRSPRRSLSHRESKSFYLSHSGWREGGKISKQFSS